MQLQCVKCGEKLSGTVTFCPFCGAPQQGADASNAPRPPPIPARDVSATLPPAAAPKPPPIPPPITVPPAAAAPAPAPVPTTGSRAPSVITAEPATKPVGQPQAPSPSTAPASAAPASAAPATPPPQKKRSGCLGCAGFIVLAIAIAGIAGYFYITNWLKQNEIAALNRDALTYIAAGDITNANTAIEKIRTLDGKSAFIVPATLKVATAKRDAVEAIKKSQAALRDRDLTGAREGLLKATNADRTNTLLQTQDTAIKAREKLRDTALEAMRKCLSANDFACGKTQANNAMRIDKSYDALAEFTKAEVAYRDAQNNPIQSGINVGLSTIFEAAANAIVRAATDKPAPALPAPTAPSANTSKTGSTALPDCDQLILQSKNARQNRRHDEAVRTAEAALAFSPACEGAQEVLDAAVTARRRAKQLAR